MFYTGNEEKSIDSNSGKGKSQFSVLKSPYILVGGVVLVLGIVITLFLKK